MSAENNYLLSLKMFLVYRCAYKNLSKRSNPHRYRVVLDLELLKKMQEPVNIGIIASDTVVAFSEKERTLKRFFTHTRGLTLWEEESI